MQLLCHFDGLLVLPEMQVMQIGQLESKITDRLATGNWPLIKRRCMYASVHSLCLVGKW